MKTLKLGLLSVSTSLSVLSALQVPNCAGQQRVSSMPVLTAPFTDADSPNASVMQAEPAVEALASIGPSGLTNLTDLLLHAPSTAQQARAAEAIGVIAFRNPGAPELLGAIPALALAAESKTLQVRVLAVQGLAAIGKPASNTIPFLVRSTKDADTSVRMCAAEALGRIGIATPQIVDALKLGLSDPSGDVSFMSLEALYRIGRPASNAIPVLVRLTKDESVGVRCVAVQTLGRLGANSPEAVAALKVCARGPEQELCPAPRPRSVESRCGQP